MQLLNTLGFCIQIDDSPNAFLRESINSLKRKYSQSSEPTDSDAAIERTLNEVAKEGCQFLLDEVFLDLEVRRALIGLNYIYSVLKCQCI